MKLIWDILATAVFALAAGALVLRWLAASGARLPRFSTPLPQRKGERPDRQTLWMVFALALLFRFAMAVVSLLVYRVSSGEGVGLAQLPDLWVRWDAQHYVKLVELGYDGYRENGQPLFLVFFPLYVWLTRAVHLVVGSTAAAGMLVSFLCYGGGCVFLYRLAAEEYGQKTAVRAVLLLSAFPFSFFFGGIMTESLFFLTTTAALYYIRRHRWWLAGIWGALAAVSRMQGLILIGAAAAELFNAERPFALRGAELRRSLGKMAKKIPALLLPLAGTLSYFLLNVSVTGSPTAFTKMQEHWSQGFLWFPDVLSYLAKNAFSWEDVGTRWDMWIPEFVLFFLCAGVLWAAWKRHRSMFTLYGSVYFILNYCLSWLLSAGRYLSCNVPLFLFAADAGEDRPRMTAAVCLGSLVLQVVFISRYLMWGQVM